MVSEVDQIEKIMNHKFSADLFIDQKRKISEIMYYHDSKTNNHGSHDITIVINPKSKVKGVKTTPKKSQIGINNNLGLEGPSQSQTTIDLYNYNPKDLIISLEDTDCWDYSTFDYENIDSEEVPMTNSPYWPFSEFESISKDKGVDIRNLILKSTCLFNLSK